MSHTGKLFTPFDLPNGTRLKNRMIKSAMSDMMGDGRGNPTDAQRNLYARWAEGGIAASIIGEVQGDPRFAEACGNLVLNAKSPTDAFAQLADAGRAHDSTLWLQLGHAGALTPAELGDPAGPSALSLPQLEARALSLPELRALPETFAVTAARAEALGFGGVQIHAAHGFVLSQFLSPLFNQRGDTYGGSLVNRMRLLTETVEAVRAHVSPTFTVALKLNSSDGLQGGFAQNEALQVISTLRDSGLDLIEISGGTYFPGAPSSSDRSGSGPYFLDFAAQARRHSDIPLMATGGFKHRREAIAAVEAGHIDMVGLARSLVLNPSLPADWARGAEDPVFPRFDQTASGEITAWYTTAIKALAEGYMPDRSLSPRAASELLQARTAQMTLQWRQAFKSATC